MQNPVLSSLAQSFVVSPVASVVAQSGPSTKATRPATKVDVLAGIVSPDFTELDAAGIYLAGPMVRQEYRLAIGRELTRISGGVARLFSLAMLSAYADFGTSPEGLLAVRECVPETLQGSAYFGYWQAFGRAMRDAKLGTVEQRAVFCISKFSGLAKSHPGGMGKSVAGEKKENGKKAPGVGAVVVTDGADVESTDDEVSALQKTIAALKADIAELTEARAALAAALVQDADEADADISEFAELIARAQASSAAATVAVA